LYRSNLKQLISFIQYFLVMIHLLFYSKFWLSRLSLCFTISLPPIGHQDLAVLLGVYGILFIQILILLWTQNLIKIFVTTSLFSNSDSVHNTNLDKDLCKETSSFEREGFRTRVPVPPNLAFFFLVFFFFFECMNIYFYFD
jgi:hypothetical protein